MRHGAAIAAVLGSRGQVGRITRVARHLESLPCFADVKWAPQFLFRVDGEVWGIDVLLGGHVGSNHLAAMRSAQERCDGFSSAVLVESPEAAAAILSKCYAQGVRVIAPFGERYVLLEPGVSRRRRRGGAARDRCRIPPALVDRAGRLRNIDNSFSCILRQFAAEHRTARRGRGMADGEEGELLKATFERLIETDQRYVGKYTPLEMLRKLEQWSRRSGFRDHYFHTFQNFLLGVVVVDEAYDHFRECIREMMPSSGHMMSVEYLWLLTALFHDVGYVVWRLADAMELIYGPAVLEGDGRGSPGSGEVEERTRQWDTGTYQAMRCQLVSLYEHLTQLEIEEDWTPEAVPPRSFEVHAFDIASADNFIIEGHGTAGSLRLAVEIMQAIQAERDPNVRRFLTRHMFMAAISIPFHDSRFRESLRARGIRKISVRRFPFAALLAFIDSIQDDRRGEEPADSSLDVLRELYVDGLTVSARINVAALPRDRLAGKQMEARELRDFLDCTGGLCYRYPEEYMRS